MCFHVYLQADQQISVISTKLEEFLHQMDINSAQARIQAATFLVEQMLAQKVYDTNAIGHEHELISSTLMSIQMGLEYNSLVSKGNKHDDMMKIEHEWMKSIKDNAQFLYDMLQQVRCYIIILTLI